MAATWVGNTSGAGGTGSLTISWPSGHQADDVGFLVIETAAAGSTLTPSGWTHVTGSPVSASGMKLNVLYKRATSSSESFVTTGDSGDHQHAAMFVIRGVAKTGVPWSEIGITSIDGSASADFAGGELTYKNGDLVVAAVGHSYDAIPTAIFSGWNFGAGSATEACDYNSDVGDGGGVALAYQSAISNYALAGFIAYHGLSFCSTCTVMFAFRQAAPPGSGVFWANNS